MIPKYYEETTVLFQKHIHILDKADTWFKTGGICGICAKRIQDLSCKTPDGIICTSCSETVYQSFANRQEIGSWHYSRFLYALSEKGPLQLRLTVLYRYTESMPIVEHQPSFDKDIMYRLLVQNLNYRTNHPLAQTVRQLTMTACIQTKDPILPYLMEHRNNPVAWQFYFNIIVCVGMIAPGSKIALEFFEEAGRHPVPEIREKVASILSRQKSPLAKKIRKQLLQYANQMQSSDIHPVSVPAVLRVQQPLFAQDQKKAVIIPDNLSPLESVIAEVYSTDKLKLIFSRYLESLFQDIDFQIKGSFSINKLKKRQLIWALAQTFSEKDRFEQFLSTLPQGVIQVLSRLTWEKGEHSAHSFTEPLDPPIIIGTEEMHYGKTISVESLNSAYVIIPVKNEYHGYQYFLLQSLGLKLFLPDLIRKNLKQYLSPPEGFTLTGQNAVGKTEFVYEDRDQILGQIHLIHTYVTQGNLKYHKNGIKLLKNSLRDMAAFCGIQEFYTTPIAETEFLKTSLIIDFLRNQSIREYQNPLELLRQIFHYFFSDNFSKSNYRLYWLLFHLKGLHNLYSEYYEDRILKSERPVREALFGILKKLSPGLWYSIHSLINYCRYRDIDLNIVDQSLADAYLSVDIKLDKINRYYSYRTANISPSIYQEAIVLPFFKGFMFLLAAFGVVDIAYNYPRNDAIQKKSTDYLSVFDGLRYIRLTPLGAYVMGLSETYAVTVEKENALIVLDEKRLLIHLDGPDRIKDMILWQFSDRITESSYKVTYDSFLKDCKTQKDIEKKISLFRNKIAEKPPSIWEDFLKDVLNKVEPLIPKPDLVVFQLKNQTELITLMAQDEILQKFIMKAEDYHVLIPAKHLNTVKKRLEKFGFFIHQLR